MTGMSWDRHSRVICAFHESRMSLQRIALLVILVCALALGGIVWFSKTPEPQQLQKDAPQRTHSIVNAAADHDYEKVVNEILTEIKTHVWPTIPEPVPIGDDIALHMLELNGTQLKFGIQAPVGVNVHRAEVFEKIVERQGAGAHPQPSA